MEVTCHPRLGGAHEVGGGHRNTGRMVIILLRDRTQHWYIP